MVKIISFRYTEKEIKEILKSLTIVIDTREKVNLHLTTYFNERNIPMKNQKLDHGDYSCMLPKNEELGIRRDIYLNSFVERKNGVDEITGNLQKNTQHAFINELIRAQDSRFVMFVEEPDFDEKVARGDYRSKYDPKALKGRLESLKSQYNFEICGMSKEIIAHNIYHRFYYEMRNHLKRGVF